jgi:hypothetical protein
MKYEVCPSRILIMYRLWILNMKYVLIKYILSHQRAVIKEQAVDSSLPFSLIFNGNLTIVRRCCKNKIEKLIFLEP